MDYSDLQKLSTSFMPSQAFLTAVELDIFNTLGREKLSVSDVARRTGCSIRGMELLLPCLCGLGLLKKRKDKFYNSRIALKYLVKSNKNFRGDAFKHLYIQYQHWSHLLDCVKTGKPIRSRRDYNRFLAGMHYHGIEKAKRIAQLISLYHPKSMLDLGAGPGTYSIAFLKKYPELTSTLIDFTEAIEWAKRIGKATGVLNRMKFIEGDLFQVNYGNGYDLVILSNILHIYSPGDNIKILKKVRNCLAKHGKIVIHDIILHHNKVTPLSATLFGLNMLIHTEQGRSYTKKEISSWLHSSGFKHVKMLPVIEGSSIILADVP